MRNDGTGTTLFDSLKDAIREGLMRVIVWALPPWVFPPAQREAFEWTGTIPMPAVATIGTPILSFNVPTGRNGSIVRIANMTTNGSYGDGDGSLVWQILQNGVPIENFENILNQLGLVQNPSEVSSLEIRAGDLIQLVVINVSQTVSGQVSGRLGGWYYPQNLESKGSFAV